MHGWRPGHGYDLFDAMSPRIRALGEATPFEPDAVRAAFELAREGSLAVCYAPFDFVNPDARLALVGITPGQQQMMIAFREAKAALEAWLDRVETCRRAKRAASFGGSIRPNLCAMLDGVGLPARLGLASAGDLFGPANALVHTTAAVRYPVFVGGANYTGHRPRLVASPLLRRMVETALAEELAAMPGALVIPLGRAAADAVDLLVRAGAVDGRRVLSGFPHPSGANGHRARRFAERRDELTEQAAAWFTQFPADHGSSK
jgi:hypothetical protein